MSQLYCRDATDAEASRKRRHADSIIEGCVWHKRLCDGGILQEPLKQFAMSMKFRSWARKRSCNWI
jgi:hypothetical protein